jgi:hypothetical protein
MNTYVYVQALVNSGEGDQSECKGDISFRHTEVSADSEDSAYDAGHQWWDKNPLPAWISNVANDYVILIRLDGE